MKKLLFAALLCPVFLWGQAEKITFTKKLVYTTGNYGDLVDVNVYYSPNGILIEGIPDNGSNNKRILIKSGFTFNVNLDLDHNITFNTPYAYSDYNYYNEIDSVPKYEFEKLKEKGQVSGFTCTYYKLIKQEYYGSNSKMCIVEDSSTDMVSFMNNEKKDKVKGFPSIFVFSSNTYLLKSVKNYSNYIFADFKGEIIKMEEAKKRYEEEYGANYTIEEAAAPVYSEYTSQYKQADTNTAIIDLAIDNLEKDSYRWKEIPQYCKDLDKKLPDFNDKELVNHVKNYVGQLCDLYLSHVQEYTVDDRATLDLIRFEENYFRNTEFDTKDRKLLNEFLNSLD